MMIIIRFNKITPVRQQLLELYKDVVQCTSFITNSEMHEEYEC